MAVIYSSQAALYWRERLKEGTPLYHRPYAMDGRLFRRHVNDMRNPWPRSVAAHIFYADYLKWYDKFGQKEVPPEEEEPFMRSLKPWIRIPGTKKMRYRVHRYKHYDGGWHRIRIGHQFIRLSSIEAHIEVFEKATGMKVYV